MEFLYPVYMSGLYNSFVSLANFNLSNLFFFFFPVFGGVSSYSSRYPEQLLSLTHRTF